MRNQDSKNPHLYQKDHLPQTQGTILDGHPIAVHVAEDYPPILTHDAVGNDDSTGTFSLNGNQNAGNSPYRSIRQGMWSQDQLNFWMPHQTGNNGDTYEIRNHFGEFARLQIGATWYRISDFFDWRVHFRLRRHGGRWHDDGSIIDWNNDEF